MTAIVHDPQNVLHAVPGHPERLERYTAIMEALAKGGLLGKMTSIPLRQASDQEIKRAHHPELVDRIEGLVKTGGGFLDPDTFCTTDSWDIARRAAGGLIELCGAVARGDQTNGLALLRPPGHHATAQNSMGFCLINHPVIAARSLQADGLADKVAIVDFDVHHGNGTEDILADDPTIFYASTHQFPHFPGTGRAQDKGTGPGCGATLNAPLSQGTGDEGFLSAYQNLIIPALEEFAPDFLLVSAGYDAHRDDPLAGLEITDSGFRQLIQLLVDFAQKNCSGKVVFTLEGGYNLDALARCVSLTAEILLNVSKEISE